MSGNTDVYEEPCHIVVELAGFAGTPSIASPDGKVIGPAVDVIAEYILSRHIKEPAITGHSLGREWLQGLSPEKIVDYQKTSIARLAKTEAVRPALVAAGINSDSKTVADAVYELMITDLRPDLARIRAPVEIVYAYDAFFRDPRRQNRCDVP